VACRIFDADGEFILIEAANHLPNWLNPDSAKCRVWLINGNISIIPQNHKIITAGDAISILRQKSLPAQKQVEEKIIRKIKTVQSNDMIHTANVYLPHKAIFILQQQPQLISGNYYRGFKPPFKKSKEYCQKYEVFQMK